MFTNGTLKRKLVAHTPPFTQVQRSRVYQAKQYLPQNTPTRENHDNIVDHFENPRNVGSPDNNDSTVGTALVGAPACGDVMKFQLKVRKNGKLYDARFNNFGCCSAIASSSAATE